MEETKEQKKLSYEELEGVALQLQQRCMIVENKLRAIDATSTRLNYLFKVMEFSDMFTEDFVDKCCTEIEELLTLDTSVSDEEVTEK